MTRFNFDDYCSRYYKIKAVATVDLYAFILNGQGYFTFAWDIFAAIIPWPGRLDKLIPGALDPPSMHFDCRSDNLRGEGLFMEHCRISMK